MHEIYALLRASWLSAASYRLSLVISTLTLGATVVPVYFVSGALQPTMAEAISSEGGQYFGFLLVGMVAMSFMGTAMESIPSVIGGGIRTGTLEALLSTGTRLPTILAGMVSYTYVWQGMRTVLLLLAGWWLGMHLVWSKTPWAVGILALIVLAYLSFGLLAAALVLVFRTSGPLTRVVFLGSTLLGGVYYPTHSIPSWLEQLSVVIPLTYGLRALRRTLLEGASLGQVMPDVAALSAFVVVLLLVGTAAILYAFRHAKRSGSLSLY